MGRIGDWLVFMREFRRTFHTTGSIVPSSRFLARAISRVGRDRRRPASFLEAGPGTGAFTDVLVRSLGPDDSLMLVELNDRFAEVIRRRIETEAHWREKQHQIRLLHGSVEELPPDDRFHVIVCGIPFSNFEPEFIDRLFHVLLSRLHPGGSFSFFEYLWLRSLKAPFVDRVERQRLAGAGAMIGRFLNEFKESSTSVLLNIPPAVVHNLRAPAERSASAVAD